MSQQSAHWLAVEGQRQERTAGTGQGSAKEKDCKEPAEEPLSALRAQASGGVPSQPFCSTFASCKINSFIFFVFSSALSPSKAYRRAQCRLQKNFKRIFAAHAELFWRGRAGCRSTGRGGEEEGAPCEETCRRVQISSFSLFQGISASVCCRPDAKSNLLYSANWRQDRQCAANA